MFNLGLLYGKLVAKMLLDISKCLLAILDVTPIVHEHVSLPIPLTPQPFPLLGQYIKKPANHDPDPEMY